MQKSKSGFTLVQLLIVIVVIGVLAAISVVMYSTLRARALDTHRTATVTNIQKSLELFYTEHGAYPSRSEMIGAAGAATLNVPISALSPPENPSVGLRHGWSQTKIENPTTSDYRFAYITHPNANGSGFGCGSDQRCQSYDLTYISTDGTPHRLTNNGNVRGN